MRLEVDVAALPAQALLDAWPGRTRGATLEARGTFVVDVALRDPEQLRYTGEGLAASGRVRGLEWSTEPFRLEGTAEEASIAGLRLTTRAERPGAEARARRARGARRRGGRARSRRRRPAASSPSTAACPSPRDAPSTSR